MKNFLHNIPKRISISTDVSWRRVWVIVITFLVSLGIVFVGLVSYASTYETRVFPGVHIGNVHVGGMAQEELQEFLQEMNDKLVDAGIRLNFLEGEEVRTVTIESTPVSEDYFFELIRMDIDKEVDALISYQKEGGMLVRAYSAFLVRIMQPHVELSSITLDTERLYEIVAERLQPFSTQPRNAGVTITNINPLTYDVVTSSPGVTFEYKNIIGRVISSWNSLEVPHIEITRQQEKPFIFDEDIHELVQRLPAVFESGGLDLTYVDPHAKKTLTWTLSPTFIAASLEMQKHDDTFGFGLSASSTMQFLENTVVEDIQEEAQEAKFEIGKNGKVIAFQGSRSGITVDVEKTYVAINNAILQRSWHNEGIALSVSAIVEQVEPSVRIGDANDLGISEILGTGFSNFSGSPPNRVKNIYHAVQNKLEGTLIKPGEEFSLINALKPFTLEGGYLPELVIKGDEIKPEIAGGLCQIGSTLFRTVMNAGLDITERRNHSLVVNYYNDHRNGKPGTDATIYDPAPDFKFKNDTGHHILLTTDMNTKTGDLYFSFWGTNDGRKGSYTEPVVHRWIPTGPEKIIETTKLAPGVRECQSAHPGAETSFTYNKKLPNGEIVEEVFSSYYRPLPKICLVGVEEVVLCQELPDGSGCAPPQDMEDETLIDTTEGEKNIPISPGFETINNTST